MRRRFLTSVIIACSITARRFATDPLPVYQSASDVRLKLDSIVVE